LNLRRARIGLIISCRFHHNRRKKISSGVWYAFHLKRLIPD
jgi:hypothetical protein